MCFVTKHILYFLAKYCISSVFLQKELCVLISTQNIFVLLCFRYQYHWYRQGPGPGMNMAMPGATRAPWSQGRSILPINQWCLILRTQMHLLYIPAVAVIKR